MMYHYTMFCTGAAEVLPDRCLQQEERPQNFMSTHRLMLVWHARLAKSQCTALRDCCRHAQQTHQNISFIVKVLKMLACCLTAQALQVSYTSRSGAQESASGAQQSAYQLESLAALGLSAIMSIYGCGWPVSCSDATKYK